jgi:tRNA(Ile2)-agmatinylcytidine synthase
MKLKTMHIGLDDTDSARKGCTTYVAALLVEKLHKLGASFIDYPNLIRLNPNVPWKTRGNGALCLRVQHDESVEDKVKETVVSTVEEQADIECKGTEPGVVFFQSATIPRALSIFARNTITGIVNLRDAVRLLNRFNGEAVAFKSGRGVVGALAAVGETLQADHTYEIIAYRTPGNYGSKRMVDEASVFGMDLATKPFTFNNVDREKKRVVITPRGPDPILFGVRGESPQIVKKAFQMVRALEPIERWVIYRTNQGTDAHLKRVEDLSQMKPYSPVIARGTVSTNPRMIRGRHVIFSIRDDKAQVDCAAYEPTGALRAVARKLIAGDQIEICGGVRRPSKGRPLTVNLEKIWLLKLASQIVRRNPLCPRCGRRLKSMGTKKGFRCDRCGARYACLTKVDVEERRETRKGLYMTSTRSQRHLTKPFGRYGMEKRHERICDLIKEWHFP